MGFGPRMRIAPQVLQHRPQRCPGFRIELAQATSRRQPQYRITYLGTQRSWIGHDVVLPQFLLAEPSRHRPVDKPSLSPDHL